MSRSNTPISHLFFVDDYMIFYKSKLTKWLAIQSVMNKYELASGQCLNRQKSSIFFSANIKNDTTMQLSNLSGVPSCSNQEKYLGLPMYVGEAKYRTFENIVDRVWARLDNWKNNHLS